MLKEAGKWDVLYKFVKLVGFKVVDGNFFKFFNKLDKLFVDVSLEDLEFLCIVDDEEVELYERDKEEE